MFARQASIKLHEVPFGWSLEGADFINKVLYSIPLTNFLVSIKEASSATGYKGGLRVEEARVVYKFRLVRIVKEVHGSSIHPRIGI